MTSTTDILGHQTILASLTERLIAGTAHHAYLLQGPDGVGKTTVARHLIAVAQCESPGPQRPCGMCGACIKIEAGTHPDVIEVHPEPGKRNIKVDAIRELVRKAGFHRYSGRYRCVLIEPAEAMNPSAANALLKTLEEPSEGTLFFLVSSQPASLLPTIRSRCLSLRMAPVPTEELAAWLAARGVPDAPQVAQTAQGCPGRALRLTDDEAWNERQQAVGEVLDVLKSDLAGIYKASDRATKGERKAWTAGVEQTLDILEELLRDATLQAHGATTGLLHPAFQRTTEAWSKALWPHGMGRCQEAVQAARRDLDAYINGKTLMDALFTRFATELGAARSVR